MLFVLLLINHPSSKSFVLEPHSYLNQFFKPLPTPVVVGLLLGLPAHQPWAGMLHSSEIQGPATCKKALRFLHGVGQGWPQPSYKAWKYHHFYLEMCLLMVLLLFSHSVMFDSLQPHGLQYTRLPYPSPSPWVCSKSRPWSQWCHPTISSSVAPFSSCPFPASGSFPVSWVFTSGGQNIRVSASASVLPMNIQGVFPLGWTGLISLLWGGGWGGG